MNSNNPIMPFNDIKQLLLTKFMLGNHNNNKENDIYYTIIIMVFISFLNYIFGILPTVSKFFTDRINKKLENISTNIIPIDKQVKSRIYFSRNYKQNEGYELIDALIEYLSNIDSVITLTRKKFYVIGQKDFFKVNENILCHLRNVSSSSEDEYERIDFELYSYSLTLTELRKWVDSIYKKIEYDKQNKFGDDRFFFNESLINNNIPSKNLMFSMTRFQTNKSLDTLYGPSIKTLKKRVDLFKNNSTWYKKNGIPHTLGILLHGSPGTGKSSTIKAIAQDLDRHIFNLKLTKNTTQQQMWNLFYNDSVYCLTDKSNNTTRHYIPTDQRLYVLEDVDCLTSVLIDRKIKEEQDKLEQIEQRNKRSNIDMEAKKRMEELQNEGENAKLNLNFLLGLIDGLLETPGRILIMSSNYPEKLDKAILRPGRIDINMELKECDIDTMREMFYNFYKERTEQDFNNLSFENMGNIFTPAYIQKILSDFFDDPLLAYNKLFKESNSDNFKKSEKEIEIIKIKDIKEDIKEEVEMQNELEIVKTEDDSDDSQDDDSELCDGDIIKTIFIDENKINIITGNIDEYGLKQVLNKSFLQFNNKFSRKFIKEILENSLDYGMAYDMLVTRSDSFIKH